MKERDHGGSVSVPDFFTLPGEDGPCPHSWSYDPNVAGTTPTEHCIFCGKTREVQPS